MTKKDYEQFAEMIKVFRVRLRLAMDSMMSTPSQRKACKDKLQFLHDIEMDIVRILKSDNPRFNDAKFSEATLRYVKHPDKRA